MDSNVPLFIQKYQQRLNAINPQAATSSGPTTPQYGPGPDNATTGYSLNNNYAVGARTYNGSSPSPQAGPGSVNPAGYATRDNMAQTKNNLLAGYLTKAGN
jgi:hypothetical protein